MCVDKIEGPLPACWGLPAGPAFALSEGFWGSRFTPATADGDAPPPAWVGAAPTIVVDACVACTLVPDTGLINNPPLLDKGSAGGFSHTDDRLWGVLLALGSVLGDTVCFGSHPYPLPLTAGSMEDTPTGCDGSCGGFLTFDVGATEGSAIVWTSAAVVLRWDLPQSLAWQVLKSLSQIFDQVLRQLSFGEADQIPASNLLNMLPRQVNDSTASMVQRWLVPHRHYGDRIVEWSSSRSLAVDSTFPRRLTVPQRRRKA